MRKAVARWPILCQNPFVMSETDPQPPKPRFRWKRFKAPAGHLFWIWVGYQAIKGTLTTAFIWIPMIYLWFQHHSAG
jgi:hypothetical protein